MFVSMTTINEMVAVEIFFSYPKIQPKKIIHNNRVIAIEQVNMVHRVRQGDHFLWIFSVSNETAEYKLSFDPTKLIWQLLEIYSP